jgi:hypothetical protein
LPLALTARRNVPHAALVLATKPLPHAVVKMANAARVAININTSTSLQKSQF